MSTDDGVANLMWGGRFARGPADIMAAINVSIEFDRRLYEQDIAWSLAHCAMLVKQGIIPPADGAAIAAGLRRVREEWRPGRRSLRRRLEDIHMNVESPRAALIRDVAGGLPPGRHTKRQVRTEERR